MLNRGPLGGPRARSRPSRQKPRTSLFLCPCRVVAGGSALAVLPCPLWRQELPRRCPRALCPDRPSSVP